MPTHVAPGMRVRCRDAEWLVKHTLEYDPHNNYLRVQCLGVDDLVKGHERIFIQPLDDFEIVDPAKSKLVADDSSGYKRSVLYLESHLRNVPYSGDSIAFDHMGAFDPLEFQKETVRHALSQLRPRLLISDAVGLGKTIQVGMIVTELMRRGRADRILVLAKKSMLTQFQAEMWNRFNIPLIRMDSQGIAKVRLQVPANKNPFEIYNRIIISMDTLKQRGRYEHFLTQAHWDVVIIDEAHNVAGASGAHSNLSNRLARLVSRHCDALLLTTATPHNGQKETFGRLISLLDEAAMPDPRMRDYDAEDIRDYFFMRFKEDVREDVGQMLPERMVVPREETSLPASSAEEEVYTSLGELRQRWKAKATTGDAHSGVMLMQYGLYKLFLSSPEACHHSLERRLENGRKKGNLLEHEEEDLSAIKKKLSKLKLPDSTRFKILLQQLEALNWTGAKEDLRVMIFTEYRQTQDALAEAITTHFKIPYSKKPEDQPNQTVAVIHGSTPDIHLMAAVEAFGTGSAPVRMMIATDVVSEGINLHHACHNIIHYDLPWSIITLIQRNGRIDRLGQEHSPVLRYLIVETDEGLLKGDGELFDRLINKVEEINKLRRSGESELQLFDAQKEEEYVATEGLLANNPDALEQAAENARWSLDDFLGAQGGTPGESEYLVSVSDQGEQERLRFFSDKEFLLAGYEYISNQNEGYLPIKEDGDMLVLTAPETLQRRLGAPNAQGDVIFGSTAIPRESWPEHDRFKLTHSVDRVKTAISAARKSKGYWSDELLVTEQHPISLWVAEQLLMEFKREETPMIRSGRLAKDTIYFCFIGQAHSRTGMILDVVPHVVSYTKGKQGYEVHPMGDVLSEANLRSMSNTGKKPDLAAAQPLLVGAVRRSRDHMDALVEVVRDRNKKRVHADAERMKAWSKKRKSLLNSRLADLDKAHPRRKQYQEQIDEIKDLVSARNKLASSRYFPNANPTTDLILVIQGEAAR